jgi:acetyltransferase-like isoleucine patch superfamily enzyme
MKKWIDSFLGSVADRMFMRGANGRRLRALDYLSEGVNIDSRISKLAKVNAPFQVFESSIEDYTYVSPGSFISQVTIGKFCSIGPNLFAGHGIHPIDGVSTHPMFYSTRKQNGYSLSVTDKIVERKQIHIGHDVFIGANVTIIDGVTIGNGAVIGAGSVVSKDIPAYAIAVGSPIKVIRFRFDEQTIDELNESRWWELPIEKLNIVEQHFFDVKAFLNTFREQKD